MKQETEIELEWMPVYWERFTKATHHMDATQVGAYLLLIREQWIKKSIPNHIGKLLNIARLGKGKKAEENLRLVLEKFKPLDADRLYNETCSEIWNEQFQKYLANKKRASKGGEARAKKLASNVLQAHSELADKKIEDNRVTNVTNQQQAHEVFAKKIFSEECDYDRVQLELGLKEKRLITADDCAKFNAHLHTEGRNHVHFSEWKSHLRNWLNTRPNGTPTRIVKMKSEKDLSSEETYSDSKSVV